MNHIVSIHAEHAGATLRSLRDSAELAQSVKGDYETVTVVGVAASRLLDQAVSESASIAKQIVEDAHSAFSVAHQNVSTALDNISRADEEHTTQLAHLMRKLSAVRSSSGA